MRSMLTLFAKKLFFSERTGRTVVETSVIQARPSEDSKDPNVGMTYEGTRRLVVEKTQKMCKIVFKHFLVIKANHSTLETKHFALPNSRITTFRCEACAEYQRSRIESEK